MANKFFAAIRARFFNTAADTALDVGVSGDANPRLSIDAGGKISWGNGTDAVDTNIYRDSADVLKTDDTFKVPALFIDGIEVDTTGATTNQILKYNGTKFLPAADGGGGGSYIISVTAPVSPSVSDVWFNSDNGRTYIYYNDGNTTQWVEFGNANSGPTGVGVATGGTIGQVLAKNSSTNYDTTWASVGSAARPLLTGGAYLSGSGLVLGGLVGNYASTPDTGPLDITGDIDIQVRATIPDWTPATTMNFVCKRIDAGNQQSYDLVLNINGTLNLRTSATGAGPLLQNNSTVATGATNGTTKWIRATLDVDDGAGNRVCKFYTSDDGTTWTQLGTTVTTAGTASIFNSNSPVEIGSRNAGVNELLTGTIHRVIIRNGYDGAGFVMFDADFSTQTADALAFNATSGTSIKADGLVLSGGKQQYAIVPDSAALSITGDIDIKTKITMSNWSNPGSTGYPVSKSAGGATRSFYLRVLNSGVLQLVWTPTGSYLDYVYTQSTVGAGVADGATKWIRATLDVDNGSSQRVVKFYTSDNGTTWTQLGTTITTAGTTSIFDGTDRLTIGGTDLNLTPMIGTVHRVIIQSAYDTANNTSSLAFDADFDAQTPETTSFVESSSNAATVTMQLTNPTVTINTTRYSYGIPEMQVANVTTQAYVANVDFYFPFRVTQPILVDMFGFEVTTGPASNSTTFMAIYNVDNDLQPVGAPVTTANIPVSTSATGIFRTQITPVVLPAGNYVMAFNHSVSTTYRTVRGGITSIGWAVGANPFNTIMWAGRTATTFTSSPLKATAWVTGLGGSLHSVHLRWKAAS